MVRADKDNLTLWRRDICAQFLMFSVIQIQIEIFDLFHCRRCAINKWEIFNLKLLVRKIKDCTAQVKQVK